VTIKWMLAAARNERNFCECSLHGARTREEWMGAVDSMKKIQGLGTDTNVTHSRTSAVTGRERILLSIRTGGMVDTGTFRGSGKNLGARSNRPRDPNGTSMAIRDGYGVVSGRLTFIDHPAMRRTDKKLQGFMCAPRRLILFLSSLSRISVAARSAKKG